MIVILCIFYGGILCIRGDRLVEIMIVDMILLLLYALLICKIKMSSFIVLSMYNCIYAMYIQLVEFENIQTNCITPT